MFREAFIVRAFSRSPSCGLSTEKQNVVTAVSGDGLENGDLTGTGVWGGDADPQNAAAAWPPTATPAVCTIPPAKAFSPWQGSVEPRLVFWVPLVFGLSLIGHEVFKKSLGQ